MENEMPKAIKGIIENINFKTGVTKAGKDYTMTQITIGGKIYSSFGEFDFKEGDKIQMVVTKNGNFNNFSDPVMVEKANLDVKVETIDNVQETTTNKNKSLKVEGFVCNSCEELVNSLNTFRQTHVVKATQTHVVAVSSEVMTTFQHIAYVWYEE